MRTITRNYTVRLVNSSRVETVFKCRGTRTRSAQRKALRDAHRHHFQPDQIFISMSIDPATEPRLVRSWQKI